MLIPKARQDVSAKILSIETIFHEPIKTPPTQNPASTQHDQHRHTQHAPPAHGSSCTLPSVHSPSENLLHANLLQGSLPPKIFDDHLGPRRHTHILAPHIRDPFLFEQTSHRCYGSKCYGSRCVYPHVACSNNSQTGITMKHTPCPVVTKFGSCSCEVQRRQQW